MATLSEVEGEKTSLRRDMEILSFLYMFSGGTHSIECRPSDTRKYMIAEGLIEWIPTMFGDNNQYRITPKGVEYRSILRNDIDEYVKSTRN